MNTVKISVLISFFLVLSLYSYSQNNMVKNGDLSRWNSGNALGYFSDIENNPLAKVADRTEGNSNGYAAKVNVVDGKEGLIRQYVKGIVPGTKYKISFWYKNDVNGCGGMLCAWRDASGSIPDDAKVLKQKLNSAQQWTKVEFELVAPEAATEFVFALIASKKCSEGSVWYDDLEFVSVK